MFLCNDDFKIASKENNDRLIALINSNKEFFYTTFNIALTTDYPAH